MDSFTNHIGVQLTETLNTPQEYYLTDDTKIPTSVYAAFKVGDGSYIISLEATSDVGVYILEVGKTGTGGGKTYWWKFHKPNDILPVLATTMHFLQSATAWLGPKIKGIAVQFKQGASDQMKRAVKLATRIIKRSYVKSFTIVPVAQPPVTDKDKYYHQKIRYLFIAKKNISLNSLFNGTTFKKYTFDGKEIPEEAVAELAPKKKKKMTQTIAVSKKYSFGQFDIDTPADTELIDKVSNIEVEPGAPTKTDGINIPSDGLLANVGYFAAMPAFLILAQKLKANGYQPSQVNWSKLQNNIYAASAAEFNLLGIIGMDNPMSSDEARENWRLTMEYYSKYVGPEGAMMTTTRKKIADYTKVAENWLKNHVSNQGKPPTAKSTDQKDTTSKKKQAVVPTDLVSPIAGSGDHSTAKFNAHLGQFEEPGRNPYELERQLMHTYGYHAEVSKLKNYKEIQSYTGSSYSNYNDPLRNTIRKLLVGDKLYNYEIEEIISNGFKFQKMFKAFDEIKPLPEALWVYRGTDIPESEKSKVTVGYQYVDPAFLSTTLVAATFFGTDRMRIFLPKGSKVIPVLNHSYHESEMEIILPPASVIKVIEVEKSTSYHKRLAIQGVFIGSAFKSITEALKHQMKVAEDYSTILSLAEFIMEQKKTKENSYDPAEKYGGKYDMELADLINQALSNGKLKVDQVKIPKEK